MSLDPQKGFAKSKPEHTRPQVKALLSGTEDDAIAMVRRHSENESFLRQAEEIEEAAMPSRGTVLKLIQQFRKTLSERSVA